MFTVGPIEVIVLFYFAFILWKNFFTKGRPVKVIREEQLYNRNKENESLSKKDQRDPVRRTERTERREEKEEDRDSGIV